MRITKIFISFLILLSISAATFAQQIVASEENWLREIAGDYCRGAEQLIYEYKNFTEEDVIKAKEKLKFIKQFAPKNEWEGLYYRNTQVGDDNFFWNADGGFFNFYCYHYLKIINFGRVKDSPDFIEVFSDKNPSETGVKFAKVKFGDRHFLVDENDLQGFFEFAAGLNTTADNGFLLNYLNKQEDMGKEVFGLPAAAERYKHLIRLPIETKITGVSERKIIPNEQSTAQYNFDYIHYLVTLGAGTNQKIKVGMNFFVEALGEWIQVTKVSPNSSLGFIRRDFDENNRELCRDGEGGSGQTIPCQKIKSRMKAETKPSL